MNNRLQQLQNNIINLFRNDQVFINNRPRNLSNHVDEFFDMFYHGDIIEKGNTELDIRRAIEVNYNDMQDFYDARIANTRRGDNNIGIDEIIWGDVAEYIDGLMAHH